MRRAASVDGWGTSTVLIAMAIPVAAACMPCLQHWVPPLTLMSASPSPCLCPQAYEGNRAPVPIYMHMPWMTQTANQKYVQKFMDYALNKPDQDVWVS